MDMFHSFVLLSLGCLSFHPPGVSNIHPNQPPRNVTPNGFHGLAPPIRTSGGSKIADLPLATATNLTAFSCIILTCFSLNLQYQEKPYHHGPGSQQFLPSAAPAMASTERPWMNKNLTVVFISLIDRNS